MPKFIVDGMRDGSNDPLYVEAANADEALSKAQAKGMHTTGVRPAKSINSWDPPGKFPNLLILNYITGIACCFLELNTKGSLGAAFFAFNSILFVAQMAVKSQTTIQKLEQEVASLRAIVNEQRTTDLREPSLSS